MNKRLIIFAENFSKIVGSSKYNNKKLSNKIATYVGYILNILRVRKLGIVTLLSSKLFVIKNPLKQKNIETPTLPPGKILDL